MVSIDTSLWQLRYVNGTMFVTQRASGVTRTFYGRRSLPSDERLAMMSEYQFDEICRTIFHS